MKSLTQPFVRVDGKLIHEGMAEYMSRGRSGACTIPAQTGSVGMHRQAVPVHKANPFTPGRLDTCDGVHGRSSTHLQRPRHQLQLSLQKDNSVDHRSRSCSRDSVVVSSAIGQPSSIQNSMPCHTALTMPCRSSLCATTVAASHCRSGA